MKRDETGWSRMRQDEIGLFGTTWVKLEKTRMPTWIIKKGTNLGFSQVDLSGVEPQPCSMAANFDWKNHCCIAVSQAIMILQHNRSEKETHIFGHPIGTILAIWITRIVNSDFITMARELGQPTRNVLATKFLPFLPPAWHQEDVPCKGKQ